MPNIKLDGEYQTRDGRAVVIKDVDSPIKNYPVVGYAQSSGGWALYSWTREGVHCISLGPTGVNDLIAVPRKHKRTYWLAHYINGGMSSYIGESNVDYLREHYGPGTIAITGPHSIEFTEGDGLKGADDAHTED